MAKKKTKKVPTGTLKAAKAATKTKPATPVVGSSPAVTGAVDIVAIAKKQRHVYLLDKIKNLRLNPVGDLSTRRKEGFFLSISTLFTV